MSSLPVIDFSPFTAAAAVPALGGAALAAAQRDVATKTHEAFRTLGFCYATGHGVDPALLSRVLAAADAFFALPESEKEQIAVEHSPSRSRGWQRMGQNVTQGKNDAHEGFDIMRELPRDHELVLDAAIHHDDCNQWPDTQPELRRVLEEYVAAMSTAGAAIMQAVAMGLGLPPGFFEQFYSESFWIARMIRYPAAAEDNGSAKGTGTAVVPSGGAIAVDEGRNMDLGCGEHTDYGCLTMVHGDSTRGCLQVRGPDGSCE
jgi:isopenicillin N synthase-like dioxygenase